MTIEEITQSTKTVLSCADICSVLGMDAQTIRMQARERPELLGFPVCCAAQQVRIPRLSFLKFMGVDA